MKKLLVGLALTGLLAGCNTPQTQLENNDTVDRTNQGENHQVQTESVDQTNPTQEAENPTGLDPESPTMETPEDAPRDY